MVTITRTRKDSCENARVLLPLTGISGVQSCAANARYTRRQTRYSVSKQHTWKYFTYRHRLFHPNFGGVYVAPDRPCWGQPAQKP